MQFFNFTIIAGSKDYLELGYSTPVKVTLIEIMSDFILPNLNSYCPKGCVRVVLVSSG